MYALLVENRRVGTGPAITDHTLERLSSNMLHGYKDTDVYTSAGGERLNTKERIGWQYAGGG